MRCLTLKSTLRVTCTTLILGLVTGCDFLGSASIRGNSSQNTQLAAYQNLSLVLNAPSHIYSGVCSRLTLTLLDSNGAVIAASQDMPLELQNNSSGGAFYSTSSNCSTMMTSLSIPAGASQITLYYLYFGSAGQQQTLRVNAGSISSNFVDLETAVEVAAAGTLDLTFGPSASGKVLTSDGNSIDDIQRIAVQPDGKVVVVGYSETSSSENFLVERYLEDGNLDPDFGSGGIATASLGWLGGMASGVKIQPDGRIVVVGVVISALGIDQFGVARYLQDGSLDPSFGSGGTVITAFQVTNDVATSLALQSDGKILVAGASYDSDGEDHMAIIRYLANGQVDSSFGSGGKVITYFGDGNPADVGRSVIWAMTVQPDGKIVAAGLADPTAAGYYQFALVRYLSNGSLDPSFGGTGEVLTDFSSQESLIYSLAIQSDGKIIAGGVNFLSNSVSTFALARYQSNGVLDSSFGSGGIVTTAFGSSLDGASSVVIQPNGSIVAGGATTDSGGVEEFALARYLANGTLDSGFGTGGKVQTQLNTVQDQVDSVALQADGKIIVGGPSATSGSTSEAALARYWP